MSAFAEHLNRFILLSLQANVFPNYCKTNAVISECSLFNSLHNCRI